MTRSLSLTVDPVDEIKLTSAGSPTKLWNSKNLNLNTTVTVDMTIGGRSNCHDVKLETLRQTRRLETELLPKTLRAAMSPLQRWKVAFARRIGAPDEARKPEGLVGFSER